MASDRILLLGTDAEGSKPGTSLDRPSQNQTQVLLTRLGYQVLIPPSDSPVPEFIAQEVVDAVLVDSSYSKNLVDLIEFFRGFESTRSIPIVALIDRPRQLQELKEKRIPRLELLQMPVSIGIMASRIATNLRVRKLEGADRSRASLGDMNANLRDINQRLSLEREEAKRIQLSLLPLKIPSSEHFELAVHYRPLEDVGGDWYYFDVSKEGILSVQIADITGHGISAAFIGSMTKLALTASATSKPAALLSSMNKLMSPVLPEGRFVTMGSFEFNLAEKILTASSAGHPPALIWKAEKQTVEEIKSPGFPLGFEDSACYDEKKLNLSSGDVLIIYTDGLSEAQNRTNKMFGTEQIAKALSAEICKKSAAEILNTLLSAFEDFREERLLKDDVTVVLMKIK